MTPTTGKTTPTSPVKLPTLYEYFIYPLLDAFACVLAFLITCLIVALPAIAFLYLSAWMFS